MSAQSQALQHDELILEEWAVLRAPIGRSVQHKALGSTEEGRMTDWPGPASPPFCRHQTLPVLAAALMEAKPSLAKVIMELEVG